MRLNTRFLAFVFAVLLFSPRLTRAQTDWKLELYSDAQMSSCAVNFNGPGIFQIHIVHTGTGPSLGVGFALYPPACMTGALWAGDRINPEFGILSNTQHPFGVGVAYNECVTLPVYLGYVQFYAFAASEPCCEYGVSDPADEDLDFIGVSCEPSAVPIASGRVIIDPTSNCPCESPVAVQSTTWGRIKSLYR